MKKVQFNKKDMLAGRQGFSLIEVILAAAIFCVFSTVAITFFLNGMNADQQAIQAGRALDYASEGMEAVRSIRDISFDNLTDTNGSGVRFSGGQWELNGDHDERETYRRVISIFPAERDGGGNVVSDGGTEDPDMKRVVTEVFWVAPSSQATSVKLETYLARWK